MTDAPLVGTNPIAQLPDTFLPTIVIIQNGWTGQIRTVTRGDDQVLQIYNWIGGIGLKPVTGYLSSTGIVQNISLATNIKGASAYQTWILAGNTGSEDDFLASLTPTPVYTNTITALNVKRVDNTIYNILDRYTKEYFTFTKSTDTVADGVIVLQLGSEFFRRNYEKLDIRWFGAVGDGIVDDTVALNKATSSTLKNVVFPALTFKITAQITFPGNKTYEFDNTTFDGHFNGFAVKTLFPGGQTFIGKLTITDSSTTVVSESTTLTKGVMFGDLGDAIHFTNTLACTILCTRLAQAFYLGAYSYSNEFGSLIAIQCGKLDAYAVELHTTEDNFNATNNILINSLRIVGVSDDPDASWDGWGLLAAGAGVTIGNLHLENLALEAARIKCPGFAVNGGYIEVHGGNNANNKTVVEGTGTFNGVFFNANIGCAATAKAVFNGCYFNNPPTDMKNMQLNSCYLQNGNLLEAAITSISQLPKINVGANVAMASYSGTFEEFGVGYNVPLESSYLGARFTGAVIDSDFTGTKSYKFTKATNDNYSGAVAFAFPPELTGKKINAWAIIKIPSANTGLKLVKVGVGGYVASGSFDINSIHTVGTLGSYVAVLLIDVVAYSNFIIFEPNDGGTAGDSFIIDSMGVEFGGLSFANLGGRNYSQLNVFRNAGGPPTTGTWKVGDTFRNFSPTPGGYTSFICVTAGSPGTWKNAGLIAS